jgi:hypothetical protein
MTGSERDALTRALASSRDHVLRQLDGLTQEQLRTPVAPSGWTPLGLVRHLTLSDERYWFQVVVDGRPLDFWPPGHNGDWLVSDDEPADGVIAAYAEAIVASDAIIAGRDLDSRPASPEPGWEEAGLAFPDLRSVLVHVLVETSVHAGHLDLVRELLDGRQHIVL